MHEHGVRCGQRHQFGIDLIGLEDRVAHFAFFLETHAGPGIGVHALRASHGFTRVGYQFDFGFRLASDAFAIGHDLGCGSVIRRRSNAEIHAETRGEIDERIANVVAVADVGELEAAQRAKFFFKREEVGKRLLITGISALAAISSRTR
jgi:hypothetical protein